MTIPQTTMVDIYEAAGATVNEDRTMVTMTPNQLKPFDIVLRVVPFGVEMGFDEGEQVILHAYLMDEYTAKTTPLGTELRHIEYDTVELKLPVSQVRILKEEK